MKETADKREFKCPFPCSCMWRQVGNPKCPVKNAKVACSGFMGKEEFEKAKKEQDGKKLTPPK